MPMETYCATRSVNYERETELELHTVVGVKEVFKLISLERAPRAAPTHHNQLWSAAECSGSSKDTGPFIKA